MSILQRDVAVLNWILGPGGSLLGPCLQDGGELGRAILSLELAGSTLSQALGSNPTPRSARRFDNFLEISWLIGCNPHSQLPPPSW